VKYSQAELDAANENVKRVARLGAWPRKQRRSARAAAVMILLTIAALAVVFAIFRAERRCSAADGVLVRTVTWYACVTNAVRPAL
jgi:hypothetical protein